MAEQFLSLREADIARTPTQRRILRGAVATAITLHAVVLAALIWHPHKTLPRVTVAHQGAISAYVNITPAPAATSGARPRPVTRPRPVSLAAAPKAPEPEPASNESSGAGQDTAVGAQGGGPVRMTTGQIQLLRKVEPIYPAAMLAAQKQATVVLDAVINPDGSIGDVMILQSSGPLFDRAAERAVKQWRYTPPGFAAVLTVTVIFSIR